MRGLVSSWRACGGLLVALVLAVLVMGPSLDALLCRDDAAAHAVAGATGQDLLAAQDAPADADDDGDDDAGPCVHGHCHHGASVGAPPAIAIAIADRASGTGTLHPLVEVSLPPGQSPFGLDRPPRA